MFVKNKNQLLHLLKKIWRWGALACLVNLMHYGVAMGQCIQPPKVTQISNSAPAGIVQLKRAVSSAFIIYTTEVEIDTTSCLPSSNEIRIKLGTAPTTNTNGILTLDWTNKFFNFGGFVICNTTGALNQLVGNCKDNINNAIDGRTGLDAVITIDVNSQCTSKTGSISQVNASTNEFAFISTCKKYKVTIKISRTNSSNMTLQIGSNTACGGLAFGSANCITSGTINYSNFVISDSAGVKLFDLSSFSGALPPVSIKYSDAPPSCAVTIPPLVVLPDITSGVVTATTAGAAIPGTTIDLPITLNCQNADGNAKVFTWTFTKPSADGFSMSNDPTLITNGSSSAAGISAQIFSTVNLTGRDKVVFTQNPTLIQNNRSYIATPTSNTTIVSHKVRLIRNSETANIGKFMSQATLTVDYQ